ncbi:MAG TPA: metalloregulator ArsR/SmtB family transcription factor [Vicinamibacteria bacterium]|jgi:DNA-binding transcriptional ArsR family regulator
MDALDATFGALADGTRRALLARLARGEASVSDLARPFAMSLPAVLKHLDTLERAGLVQARKEGRVRRCRLRARPLAAAGDWIARYRLFWEERFEALDRYLQEGKGEEERKWRARGKQRTRSGWPGRSRRRGRGSSTPGSIRRR